MLVHWVAGGLHYKNIHTAHILKQLKVNFAVCEPLQLGFAYLYADVQADFFSQRAVGGSAEELEAAILTQIAGPLAIGAGLPSFALAES